MADAWWAAGDPWLYGVRALDPDRRRDRVCDEGDLDAAGQLEAVLALAPLPRGLPAAPVHDLVERASLGIADRSERLRPLAADTAGLAQLKRDLAVVISAEALFTLTDPCGLSPEDAIASAVHTARTLTQAATGKNRLAATRV